MRPLFKCCNKQCKSHFVCADVLYMFAGGNVNNLRTYYMGDFR
jgi:hypothetical protein